MDFGGEPAPKRAPATSETEPTRNRPVDHHAFEKAAAKL